MAKILSIASKVNTAHTALGYAELYKMYSKGQSKARKVADFIAKTKCYTGVSLDGLDIHLDSHKSIYKINGFTIGLN